jgi:polar amino acid transport system permease protein
VQLFYIYFVLPDIGIQLSAFQAGVIGLGIAYSAYQAENFRAGIEAVDVGQIEAAQSIGMRGPLIMRRVILPQAFRIAAALWQYAGDDAQGFLLVSTITVLEMTRAGQMIASSTFQNMTVYTVAVLYLLLSLPLVFLIRRLEIRHGKEGAMIEVKHISKCFGQHEVLKDVSLSVAEGRWSA